MTDPTANPVEPSWKYTELSIDQQLALTTAATRPATDVNGVYGPETIERFLHSSYERVATVGSIPHFLPLLAERFARPRLQALARVEGHHRDGKPSSRCARSATTWNAVSALCSTSSAYPPAPDTPSAGGTGLPAAAPWRTKPS